MVAVSATVLTGWAGQLSLGQFAFVAVGALPHRVLRRSRIGIPPVGRARRRSGAWRSPSSSASPRCASAASTSAIITLGFALVVSGYVILQARLNKSFTGFGRVSAADPHADPRTVGPRDRQAARTTTSASARAARRHPDRDALPPHRHRPVAARRARQRDNAAAYTVSPTRAKLIAFALSGGVAAFAGGLFAARQRHA